MTVDKALEILQKAKEQMGGDATLILSLSDSGLPDTFVNDMEIIFGGDDRYVEVQAFHPDLQISD